MPLRGQIYSSVQEMLRTQYFEIAKSCLKQAGLYARATCRETLRAISFVSLGMAIDLPEEGEAVPVSIDVGETDETARKGMN